MRCESTQFQSWTNNSGDSFHLIIADDSKEVFLDLENGQELSLLHHRLGLAELRDRFRLLHVLLETRGFLIIHVFFLLPRIFAEMDARWT